MGVAVDPQFGEVDDSRIPTIVIDELRHLPAEDHAETPIFNAGIRTGLVGSGNVIRVFYYDGNFCELQKVTHRNLGSRDASHRGRDRACGKYVARRLVGIDTLDIRTCDSGEPSRQSAGRVCEQYRRTYLLECGYDTGNHDGIATWT